METNNVMANAPPETSHVDADSTMQHRRSSSDAAHVEKGAGPDHEHVPLLASATLSHSLPHDDPGNPANWHVFKRIYTSFQAWAVAFTVALGLTCYTAGKKPFVKTFDLQEEKIPIEFIAGFSLYLFGIMLAPYWVPHVSERIGRSLSYFVYLVGNILFNLGAGLSPTLSGVLVCRFFAGFFGGPSLVLLEGTFADIWSSETTNTYYAFQGLASFWGAGIGPLVGGYLVTATGNWRWTQYFPVILGGVALLILLGIPETYQREIPRRRTKATGKTRKEIIASQPPAQSGTTLIAMINCTVIQPAVQFFTEIPVALCAIIMFIDWFLTFQWFISVPAALGKAGFDLTQIGLAFTTVPAGSALGALSVIAIEMVTNRMQRTRNVLMGSAIEFRVLPAFIGAIFVTVSYFWVANTVSPHFRPVIPIIGTGVFVWGSSMITFSIVPYTFDLYAPAGTLSAITCQAVGRILAAAILPFLILQDITSPLGAKWGLGLFGFISLIMWPIPIVLFCFGERLRTRSKYAMAM